MHKRVNETQFIKLTRTVNGWSSRGGAPRIPGPVLIEAYFKNNTTY